GHTVQTKGSLQKLPGSGLVSLRA
ncbi:MAG: hypothetical protein JWQ03_2197, partial [Variovorax sp.]|nr:hypothetical protein [Variovorax sp.]